MQPESSNESVPNCIGGAPCSEVPKLPAPSLASGIWSGSACAPFHANPSRLPVWNIPSIACCVILTTLLWRLGIRYRSPSQHQGYAEQHDGHSHRFYSILVKNPVQTPCLWSAFQPLVALAVVASTLCDPTKPTVAVGGLVGPILVKTGMQPGFSRRFIRVFRRNRLGEFRARG